MTTLYEAWLASRPTEHEPLLRPSEQALRGKLPGYRRIDVSFEEKLQREVDRLRPHRSTDGTISTDWADRPLGDFSPEASIDMTAPVRFDGSNVQIDREMVDLAKTTGKITELTELFVRQQRVIKAAILGRNQ